MISEHTRAIIACRIESELLSIQYFNTEADPAWLFEALDRILTELLTGVYSEVKYPCAEMAGRVWTLTCRGKYQEASRKHVISMLFNLNNELKKSHISPSTECGAV